MPVPAGHATTKTVRVQGVDGLFVHPFSDPAVEKAPFQFQAIPRIGYPSEIAAAAQNQLAVTRSPLMLRGAANARGMQGYAVGR